MARSWTFLVLLTALLMGVPTVSAAPDPDLRPRIDEIVAPFLEGEMTVGLVIGVIDSSGTWVAGYGTTSNDGGRIPGGNTVFEMGSMTKVFCALLLADMAERGEVRLDDPAGYFLPSVVPLPVYAGNPERQITLLDLVSHTSGFPRTPSNLEPKDLLDPYADYSVAKMYEFISGYTLPGAPGTVYEYSNIGMGLLGHVLSLKAGKSFEELVAERIADPLGMKDTRITLSDEQRRQLAEGHNADGAIVPNWELPAIPAAGAFFSTVDDLLRFLSANLGLMQTPLASALATTHRPVKPIGQSGNNVAMAWHIQPGGVIWHNGQSGGYHGIMAFLEPMGIGVVVLSNSAVMVVDQLGLTILKMMAGEEVEPLNVRIPAEVDPSVFAQYTGSYELPMGMSVEVFRDGNHLMIQPKDQAPVRLYPESETQFFLKVLDAQVEFLMEEDLDHATHLIWTQGDRQLAGRWEEE